MNTKTILVADDSPVVLKTLEIRLKSAGYRVVTAVDPGEALEKVRTEKPDVIIMDINFPPDVGFGGGGTWDGYRILEWMKLNKSLGEAIQIIITGENIEQHQAKAKAAGVKGLFQKPIDAKLLLNRIKECLEPPAPST
jgi:CheY-like chemotaxis protein